MDFKEKLLFRPFLKPFNTFKIKPLQSTILFTNDDIMKNIVYYHQIKPRHTVENDVYSCYLWL